MTIAATLRQYLTDRDVSYDVIAHPLTMSSSRTAQQSHISGDRVAKAVLVKDGEGFMVAVVPASHHVRLGELSKLLDRPVGLANEKEGCQLFPDCETGAFPAVGTAYGLEVVVDDSIAEQSDVYFEGGDHTSLVHVTADQFRDLMPGARHGRFSDHD